MIRHETVSCVIAVPSLLIVCRMMLETNTMTDYRLTEAEMPANLFRLAT